jgi:hypothetical protein
MNAIKDGLILETALVSTDRDEEQLKLSELFMLQLINHLRKEMTLRAMKEERELLMPGRGGAFGQFHQFKLNRVGCLCLQPELCLQALSKHLFRYILSQL